MRRTKIICTLGPATDGKLEELVAAGMNVARFNMSHGSHEEHAERIKAIKDLRESKDVPIGILIDTKGPEIRVGKFDKPADLVEGQTYTLTTEGECICDENRACVTHKGLAKDVRVGMNILFDDGSISMTVVKVEGTEIICKVNNSGKLSSSKSLNLPGVILSLPYMSPQDKADIIFGVEQGMEYVAASFVRTAMDIMEIRALLNIHGGEHVQIIAKIENAQGVENVENILEVSDGIMIARGDMGVEIDFAALPRLQKSMISSCLKKGKRSITATQMLDSMIKNPRPTRAEVTDVANAVYDGTSAVMLSGESSIGKYPVETVRTMAEIVRQAEEDIDYKKRMKNLQLNENGITAAISHATCTTAHDLNAAAIVACSISGRTARTISSYRPAVPIICCTPSRRTFNMLSMSWGICPVMTPQPENAEDIFRLASERSLSTQIARSGDIVVITSGVPLGVTGTTDTLKVMRL